MQGFPSRKGLLWISLPSSLLLQLLLMLLTKGKLCLPPSLELFPQVSVQS